jgi:hypothetical protein
MSATSCNSMAHQRDEILPPLVSWAALEMADLQRQQSSEIGPYCLSPYALFQTAFVQLRA